MSTDYGSEISVNHLSEELVIKTLHFCNYKEILQFAATCKEYFQLVASTISLQLHIELEASGLEITNGSSKVDATYSSILAELRRYRDAWLYMDLSPAIKHSGAEGEMLWELREGAYVTAFPSPASRGQSDSFRLIPLGSPTLLPPAVNFHTDFHEFTLDLKQELAVLVAVDTGSATRATIHLRSTITGLPHPRAQHSMLAVEFSFSIPYERAFGIVPEIMDNILLVKFEDYSRMCEIVTLDWRTGALLHRIDSCGRICNFSILDKSHIILYTYTPSSCEHSGQELQSFALQVYNISSASDHDVPLDARYNVPLYPFHHPILRFDFPRLHHAYDTSPLRLSMRSWPPPGRAMHTNSATFACSHALTLGLTMTLSRRPGVRNDLEDALSFRVFVDGSKLLDHMDESRHGGTAVIPWEKWGSNATRWFVHDGHNEEDWVYWISGSRYVRTGLHSMTRGSELLSTIDFHTPTIKRSFSLNSNPIDPQAVIHVDADKDVVLDGKRLISTPSLKDLVQGRSQPDSFSDGNVFIETVGSDVPTIISAGFQNAFESRLPYRIATRARPVQVHEAWLIEGDYIIGARPLGASFTDRSVYELKVSA